MNLKHQELENFREFTISTYKNYFDLFSLHSITDKHPRSWICVKGNGIKEIIYEIEQKLIIEKVLTREAIARILSRNLNCSRNSFKAILRGQTNYYPIPFVLELVNMYEDITYLTHIHSKIEYLKVNSASSKQVLAIKHLIPDLCKIIGAFMADGSLTVPISFSSKNKLEVDALKLSLTKLKISYNEWYLASRNEYSISITLNQENYRVISKLVLFFSNQLNIQSHYSIELTDEHKSSVNTFRQWMLNTFGITPIFFKKKKGAWRVSYSNKIIARYLMTFFEVIPGPKTYTAFEPEIIKNAPLEMRKLFARGVLMFDGCFSAGKISFSSKSSVLQESIKDIMIKDEINVGTTNARGDYILFTYENNKKEKFLEYFETDTYKWSKVNDLITTNKKTIEQLITLYRYKPNNKIDIDKLYTSIKDVKTCDLFYLASYFHCSTFAISHYLTILRNNELITISTKPSQLNPKFVNKKTSILLKEDIHNLVFSTAKKKFKTYLNLAKLLGVGKAAFSAWKLRKNRIPITIVEKICTLCDIDYTLILNNIEKTDRQIIEII